MLIANVVKSIIFNTVHFFWGGRGAEKRERTLTLSKQGGQIYLELQDCRLFSMRFLRTITLFINFTSKKFIFSIRS